MTATDSYDNDMSKEAVMDKDRWLVEADLEILRNAKAKIATRDQWVQGTSDLDGRVCAAQALHDARLEWLSEHTSDPVNDFSELGFPRLKDAANTLYYRVVEDDDADVVYVNDQLGFDAVHAMYDYAIKTAASELEGGQ